MATYTENNDMYRNSKDSSKSVGFSDNNNNNQENNTKNDENNDKCKDETDGIPEEPIYEPVQESGLLNVGISYNGAKNQLELTILNVKNIPSKDRGAPPIIQVRLLLLPARVRRWKTKVQNTDQRVFNEVFRMRHITQNELDHLGIRLRLYGIGKVKDRLIGEAVIDLGELNLPQYFCEDSRTKILEQMNSTSSNYENSLHNQNRTQSKNQNINNLGAGSATSHIGSKTPITVPKNKSHTNTNNSTGTQASITSSSLSLNNNSQNSTHTSKSGQMGGNPYANTNNIRSSAFSMGVNKIGSGTKISDEILNTFSSSSHVSLTLTIKLDPRANLIDKPSLARKQHQVVAHGAPKEAAVIYNSSLTMIQFGGESPQILIGLSYNAQTGRLCIQLIKGSHFGDRAFSEAPNTYVKLVLLDHQLKEVSKSKSTIRENTPNPVFRERFFFEVAANQLNLVTVTARVMVKANFLTNIMKKNKESQNVVGWITMGAHNSDFEQSSHWQEMARAKGQEVCRWHTLLEEDSVQ